MGDRGRHSARQSSALLLMFGGVSLGVAAAAQTSVTLGWNPSTSSSVTGYKVYYGVASRNYTNSIAVGNTTVKTLSGLHAGTTYYAAATTLDARGLESVYSDEIRFVATPTNLARLQLGRSANSQGLVNGRAPPGYTYQVQASENLVNWAAIGTVIVNAAGSYHFTDPAAATLPQRFYRLLEIGTGPPRLFISRTPKKEVVLSGKGTVGNIYYVQASQNLVSWTTIGSVTAGATGSFQFTNAAAASLPTRFYRLAGSSP